MSALLHNRDLIAWLTFSGLILATLACIVVTDAIRAGRTRKQSQARLARGGRS